MANLPIKYVKDKDGKFIPITSPKAVIDANGKNIEDIFARKEDVISSTTYLYSGTPEANNTITLGDNLSNYKAVLIEVISQYYEHMFSYIPYDVFTSLTDENYAPFIVGEPADYYTGFYVSDTSIKIKSKASVTLAIRIWGVN